jgi:hypothetical protein
MCRKGLLFELCAGLNPDRMFLVTEHITACEQVEAELHSPELQKRAATPATWGAVTFATSVSGHEQQQQQQQQQQQHIQQNARISQNPTANIDGPQERGCSHVQYALSGRTGHSPAIEVPDNTA